ncbi:MAG: peptide chain release factor 2 [Dehalococcoidia bacterium]|nr:peptide chain release factor 2 [Dehalococcoidia bacterium]
MEELIARLAAVSKRVSDAMVRLDVPEMEEDVRSLEKAANEPDFWDDSSAARVQMRRMASLNSRIEPWRSFERRAADVGQMIELVQEENAEESMGPELAAQVAELENEIGKLELQIGLSGEYDDKDAVLAIHSGAGGTEAQDWAQMLMRMYLRWAEDRGYKAEIIDVSHGEEAGIKSAMIEVSGPYAYGYLKSERGVHRLVRLSPFDADHARHTSFALVEVMPEPDDAVDIVINPDDIKMDAFRSSGAGGQNVQKTSTAVRITHIPSGIVVTCQNERSQLHNKDTALKVLKAKLIQADMEKRAEEQAIIKGEHISAGWGNQIRSYVLHPYKLVKDLRTGYETSDPDSVLNGGLDEMIDLYLRSQTAEARK